MSESGKEIPEDRFLNFGFGRLFHEACEVYLRFSTGYPQKEGAGKTVDL
jgi:hypothetical protein